MLKKFEMSWGQAGILYGGVEVGLEPCTGGGGILTLL